MPSDFPKLSITERIDDGSGSSLRKDCGDAPLGLTKKRSSSPFCNSDSPIALAKAKRVKQSVQSPLDGILHVKHRQISRKVISGPNPTRTSLCTTS